MYGVETENSDSLHDWIENSWGETYCVGTHVQCLHSNTFLHAA